MKTKRTTYLLRRPELKDRTLGHLLVFEGLALLDRFVALELIWKDNKRNISRYPAGRYTLVPRSSQSKGNHLEIIGIPGRTLCLVHRGCFPDDTEGCTLVGMDFKDLDGDKIPDVCSSRVAMDRLCQLITEPTDFIVVDP